MTWEVTHFGETAYLCWWLSCSHRDMTEVKDAIPCYVSSLSVADFFMLVTVGMNTAIYTTGLLCKRWEVLFVTAEMKWG